MNVHWRIQSHSYIENIAAVELVRFVDRFGFPVRPVHIVLEDSDGKWVLDVLSRRQYNISVVSFEVGAGNDVKLCIYPVEATTSIVYNENSNIRSSLF